jgi:hypothetical protein
VSRRLAILFGLGLLLRLAALPAWGTIDMDSFKAWSVWAATRGLTDMYGPQDRQLVGGDGSWRPFLRPPETRFEWRGRSFFMEYPPGSALVFWTTGRLYRAIAPEMRNGRLFNAVVNLPPFVGSLAIAWLLWRSAPGRVGGRRALLFWLNPAAILAAPLLGYQDTVFAAIALAAVLALMRGRHPAATALVVSSAFVKPQAALLLPTLITVTLRETPPRAWARAALAGAATGLLVLLPWWSRGYLFSALGGTWRTATQGDLAPLGFNVWWLAGYAMDWAQSGPWPLASVKAIVTFRDWAGFDPRPVSRLLVLLGTIAIVFLVLGRKREERFVIPLAVILQVHTYALFGTSVHENHTLLAVVLAPLLVGAWPRGEAVVGLTSGFLLANLLLAVGLGRGITTQALIKSLRLLPRLDLSVVVAAGHVALLALLFVWAARVKSDNIPAP